MTSRVSYFQNVKIHKTKDIYITDFLKAVQNQRFRLQIQAIRNESNKDKKLLLKQQLQCITVSGTFNQSHRNNDLIQHSGLMQIDIDDLLNAEIEVIRTRLQTDKYTYACFLSPSGNGLKLIFKIPANNITHLQSFLAIEKYFLSHYDLQIDKACKDVSRPMFVSSDKDLYFNADAEIFTSLFKKESTVNADRNIYTSATIYKDEFSEVATICNRIVNTQTNITYGYNNWLKLGFALANLGENGRAFFHQLSALHPKYSFTETDKQFTNCMRNKNSGVTLKSFFYMAKDNGITVRI
jgi:hypothetical protein